MITRVRRALLATAVAALAVLALAACGGSDGDGWRAPDPVPGTRPGQGSVAFAGDGRALAVWVEAKRGEARLMFAERPPGGGWTGAVPIQTSGRWSIIGPQLAVNARGDAALTFSLSARQSRVLMGSHRSAGGGWEEPQTLAPVGRNLGEPVVGIGERGQVVVAWPELGVDAGVGVSRRDAAGGWSDPQRIPVGPNFIEAAPALAPDGRAYLLAEAFDARGIRQPRVLASEGRGWAALPRLPGGAGRQVQGALALDGEGRPTVVAFRPGRRGGTGTFVATRLEADGRWSRPQVLDRADGSWFGRVEMATTDEGILVAWTRWSESRQRVSVRAALIEDGHPVAAAAEVDAFDVPGARAPATRRPETDLRLAAGGRPTLLWDRQTEPRPRREALLMASRYADGAWTAPEPVTDGPLAALPGAIHADERRTVAVWRELPSRTGGPAEIVAAERAN